MQKAELGVQPPPSDAYALNRLAFGPDAAILAELGRAGLAASGLAADAAFPGFRPAGGLGILAVASGAFPSP